MSVNGFNNFDQRRGVEVVFYFSKLLLLSEIGAHVWTTRTRRSQHLCSYCRRGLSRLVSRSPRISFHLLQLLSP
jgi:hypothetical protein